MVDMKVFGRQFQFSTERKSKVDKQFNKYVLIMDSFEIEVVASHGIIESFSGMV